MVEISRAFENFSDRDTQFTTYEPVKYDPAKSKKSGKKKTSSKKTSAKKGTKKQPTPSKKQSTKYEFPIFGEPTKDTGWHFKKETPVYNEVYKNIEYDGSGFFTTGKGFQATPVETPVVSTPIINANSFYTEEGFYTSLEEREAWQKSLGDNFEQKGKTTMDNVEEEMLDKYEEYWKEQKNNLEKKKPTTIHKTMDNVEEEMLDKYEEYWNEQKNNLKKENPAPTDNGGAPTGSKGDVPTGSKAGAPNEVKNELEKAVDKQGKKFNWKKAGKWGLAILALGTVATGAILYFNSKNKKAEAPAQNEQTGSTAKPEEKPASDVPAVTPPLATVNTEQQNQQTREEGNRFAYNQGATFTVQRGDIPWNTVKRILTNKNGVVPTDAEIIYGIRAMAKENNLEYTPDHMRIKGWKPGLEIKQPNLDDPNNKNLRIVNNKVA